MTVSAWLPRRCTSAPGACRPRRPWAARRGALLQRATLGPGPRRGVRWRLPGRAAARLWLPLQGDTETLALYHVTSDGWPAAGRSAPITDWTPGGETRATCDACVWTRLSQANECRYLVNVPPPPPKVALRIDGITTTPNPPVNPNYFMHYRLGCDLTEASVNFNGDEVGYIFRLYQDGIEREAVTLDAFDVASGETGVDFTRPGDVNHTTPCPVVTCSVEASTAGSTASRARDQKVAGSRRTWRTSNGALNRSFTGLAWLRAGQHLPHELLHRGAGRLRGSTEARAVQRRRRRRTTGDQCQSG
ncbi:MAG: hypothetical protein M5U09_30440, partial [Gammaproteobacteria bacterium]|nr:hypothetical protein [Gammaproteobacteria bacterium]